MFLLFLGLGTVSVNAQVRIGGNAAPNASAVLDLNANDTNNGTKGLALPRVGLTSNTMLLPGVTANLTGMLVYNTTTTGGAGVNTIGIYFWNGATWVRASLPSTSAADSGKFLVSNGSNWVASEIAHTQVNNNDSIKTIMAPRPITWELVVDTIMSFILKGNTATNAFVAGVTWGDVCYSLVTTNPYVFFNVSNPNRLEVWYRGIYTTQPLWGPIRFRCLRPIM